MIFDNDFTSLNGGASAIPMDESYNNSYGAALALVEGARNDFKMFNAMIRVEAAACKINESANGVVREGEMQALQEASVKGIWAKIKSLFEKLIAKIKAIFHNFMSKINGLYMKDKELIKKYEAEVLRKTNIDKLEVKWRKAKGGFSLTNEGDCGTANGWDSESDKRVEHFLSCSLEDANLDAFLDDEETVKLSEVNGIRGVINFLKDSAKNTKDAEKKEKDAIKACDKAVKDADKKANDLAKSGAEQSKIDEANKAYDMASAFQTASLKYFQVVGEKTKAEYKQNKAAFMKAVAANDKKLEEQVEFLDAVAEAAEQEVEDVIQGAIDSNADATDIGASSVASENVKDGDVSDDPDKNVADYAKGEKKGQVEKYEKDKVDGTVDTDYNGKESAFFGELFY